MCRPSGSAKDSTSSSKRVSALSTSTPLARRSFQYPSDPSGTEKLVVLVWPVPRRPRGAPGHEKKVRIVPGLPTLSP